MNTEKRLKVLKLVLALESKPEFDNVSEYFMLEDKLMGLHKII